MVILYDSEGNKKAILDNIIKETAKIKRVVNGEYIFGFDALEKELKSEFFTIDNTVEVNEQRYDIKYIEQSHESGKVVYKIQCEHVNYRLNDGEENQLESFAMIGTPTEILSNILNNTDFTVGSVEYTDTITISVGSKISKKGLIYELANLLGAELEYTNKGFEINLLNTIGKNNDFEIRIGKNLKGITKTIDGRGGFKTHYAVDILELKNSNTYIKEELQDLEVIEIGDEVRIIDEVLGVDVKNRILSMEYNPIRKMNTSLEIANTIELITDKINKIATNAVMQGEIYNNVSISRDYGFRAVRSDKRARATLNADGMVLDVGDGDGNYTSSLFFDASIGKYKFVGDIEASGNVIGGTINIGNGTFTVDNTGHVIANSIQVGSATGIANFDDAGSLATVDKVGNSNIQNGAITSSKIATGAVTASEINVDSLSAISANIGTITAGTLTGVNINADTFNAEKYINIKINNPKEGLYFRTWIDMFIRVLDAGGTLEIGPSAKIPETLYIGHVRLREDGDGRLKIDRSTNVDGQLYVENEEVITGAGDGLSKSDDTLSIDRDVVVCNNAGQEIRLQVYDGHLEYSLNGGSYTRISNG